MALSKVGIGSLKLYYLGDRGVPDMCVCRGQKLTLWSQFYPWVLAIELRSPGLLRKSLYLLRRLTGPRFDFCSGGRIS